MTLVMEKQDGAGPSPPTERTDALRQVLRRYAAGQNHLRRGLCYLAAGCHDEAAEALTAASHTNPESLSLPQYLAAAYAGGGRFRSAAAEYQQLAQRAPENVAVRIRHALALWKGRDRAGAVAALREAVRVRPESAELHFQLGTMLAAMGETDEAELRFTQAVVLNKHHADAWAELGMCYGARNQPGEAVRCLKSAQTQNPADARLALLLTYALKAAGQHAGHGYRPEMPSEDASLDEEALAPLAAIIQAEPEFVEAFLGLEDGEVDRGIFALLAETLTRALERAPEHADLLYHCGRVWVRLGKTAAAIEVTERAVTLRPRYIQALIQLAKLYQQSDRRLDARRRLEEAIRCGAEYADVYHLLGNLYRDEGRLPQAQEAYAHALNINPQYTEAREALAALSGAA